MTASGAHPVSVIVVSRHRPEALRRCLLALRLQDHPMFEVIVVACPAGVEAVQTLPFAAEVKLVAFDEANISSARNEGLNIAAGDVCAFIDDDAIAEPTWLPRLTAPFDAHKVTASGGFVVGRNGMSLQWGALKVDDTGRDTALALNDTQPSVLPAPKYGAIRTQGTNMAVRRADVLAVGGFDPAFRFFLDETDLSMRLARAGAVTAIVPGALVQHGFAPSRQRRADRAPLTLYDIGASTAVFLRKHTPLEKHHAALAAMRVAQTMRLHRHLITGALEPRDIRRLLQSLEDGVVDGTWRLIAAQTPLLASPTAFRRFSTNPATKGSFLVDWIWNSAKLASRARIEAENGHSTTILRLSPSVFWHRSWFHSNGYWEQSGGLWGKSARNGPFVVMGTKKSRNLLEKLRISKFRPM
jgi:GT2 family glycosyltransferase